MNRLVQNSTPLFDALKNYADSGTISFAVPGHKHGEGLKELRDYLGEKLFSIDVNGMEGLDFACHPTSVIKESQKLLAQAYGGQEAFFLVNGTTQGVQTMILSTCKSGDKIILPRNAHKSTFSGIILSGAIPVYVEPEINIELGIAMGVDTEKVKKTIKENKDAKAIYVLNPTYYGVASDLKGIVRAAHREGISVLIDEAHGAHMAFHDGFPITAMEVGADMSAISLHKTGGAMTQASALVIGGNYISPRKVREFLNITHTTSASYILMASLDVARKQLAVNGEELLQNALELSKYAREKINNIPGLYAFGKELIGTPGCYDIDGTKLCINVRKLGISGFEMERILRNKYNILVELGDLYNVLAVISIGDNQQSIDKLVDALYDIAKDKGEKAGESIVIPPPKPCVIVSPRDAFYSKKRSIKLSEAVGEICGESVMAYPPGIPIISPGEKITKDIIKYINMLKKQRCELQGSEDATLENIRVLGEK